MNNIDKFRKENLEYLIDYKYATQSSLAANLGRSSLSQATLSDVLREKRSLHEIEARLIEQKLAIPNGWMDKDGWIEIGNNLIEKYQNMTEEQQNSFNELVEFVESQHRKA